MSITSAGDEEITSKRASMVSCDLNTRAWKNSLESLLDNETMPNVDQITRKVTPSTKISPSDNMHLKLPESSPSSEGRTPSSSKTSSLGSSQGKYFDKNDAVCNLAFKYNFNFELFCQAFFLISVFLLGHPNGFVVRQGRQSRMSSNASSSASSAPSSVENNISSTHQQHVHSHSNSDSGLSSLTGKSKKNTIHLVS